MFARRSQLVDMGLVGAEIVQPREDALHESERVACGPVRPMYVHVRDMECARVRRRAGVDDALRSALPVPHAARSRCMDNVCASRGRERVFS